MTGGRRQAAGFTLLEMLLAITLLTLLAGLAYGTLRIGVRGWETANLQADQGDALRVAWPFLHQTLETARPLIEPGSNRQRFNGEAQQLHWISELPVHFAGDGPRALTLAIEESDGSGQQRLVLTSRALDETQDQDRETRRATLVDDVEHLAIAYYGPPEHGGGVGWQDSWRQRTTLPHLIRLTVTPRGAASWPQLIARPYLAPILPGDGGNDSNDPERND